MSENQSLGNICDCCEWGNCSVLVNASGTSGNITGQQYDIIHDQAVQVLFCILYTTIFILGVFGNVLVCYVVGRNRAMQTVTNFFITNLALSDILLCVLAVPFTPLYTFLGQWIFGGVLCRLVSCAQGISVYISTLTLTSIAIDRFFVIIYPFQQRMQLVTCLIIIFSIWMFSLVVTLPYGIYIRHNFYDGRYYCEESWPNEHFRQLYGALTTQCNLKEFKQVLPCFDPSAGRPASGNMGRVGGWRSERTCNGNETMQETLLPTSTIHRSGSVRIQMSTDVTGTTKGKEDNMISQSEAKTNCKPVQEELQTVLIPAATYSTEKDTVHLHLTTGGDNTSSPPSKPTNMLKSDVRDTTPLACVLRETL
ncbi:hypothetical protein L9F63_000400 [Diploptera punctata]|uniref:G-protein coupled receptors family 1 profile domain-containing protein n=1 Tax=Diploptera punctata TaxID=6984 RepID=A0AAD8APH5_DIPPU|nr:hypothetical protein L9F63_000400 [Diploptera punctata]